MGWKREGSILQWGLYSCSMFDPLGQRSIGWVEQLSPTVFQGSTGNGEWVRCPTLEEAKLLVETTLRMEGKL